MLNIELENRIDPYSKAIELLVMPGVYAKIQSDKIQIAGNNLSGYISGLDIARVTNYQKTDNYSSNYPIVENGRITHIKSNFRGYENQERPIRKGQVWLVDFGQPVGNEFGYPHPAIVLGKSSTNDCMMVIPCSSKEKSGKTFKFNVTEETLKFADPDFLERSTGKTTTVLIDQRIPVDRVRFLKYFGDLEKNLFEKILRESGLSDDEIKRNISMTTLDLTEKQRKIMEMVNRNSDILAVANNTAFTYQQRVRALLSIFDFKLQIEENIEYLEGLIKNTRYKTDIDIKIEIGVLAKNTIENAQTINNKLVDLVRKHFRPLWPCLVDFVLLINKLAS